MPLFVAVVAIALVGPFDCPAVVAVLPPFPVAVVLLGAAVVASEPVALKPVTVVALCLLCFPAVLVDHSPVVVFAISSHPAIGLCFVCSSFSHPAIGVCLCSFSHPGIGLCLVFPSFSHPAIGVCFVLASFSHPALVVAAPDVAVAPVFVLTAVAADVAAPVPAVVLFDAPDAVPVVGAVGAAVVVVVGMAGGRLLAPTLVVALPSSSRSFPFLFRFFSSSSVEDFVVAFSSDVISSSLECAGSSMLPTCI